MEQEGKSEELQAIQAVERKLDDLAQMFTEKIETDTYKNALFDQMHQELRQYQEDAISSITDPIIMELIGLKDQIGLFLQHIPEEPTPDNYSKLRRRYEEVAEDLGDILENLDVQTYMVEGNIPDPKRQKILKTVPTDEPELDNTVEKKIAQGYMKKNRIIKYEKISIYKYQEEKKDGSK